MKLIIERGKTVSFESLPPQSIALDGYVQGPGVDSEKERYSFDHHDKCIRLVTSASCVQVLDALLLGLNPADFTTYVNDVDEDTILSVWLLKHPDRAGEHKVRRLMEVIGKIDAHGLAYPLVEQPLYDTFHRIVMAPIARHRAAGTFQTTELTPLLAECVSLVDEFLQTPEELSPVVDLPWQVVFKGSGGWVMYITPHKIYAQVYRAGFSKAVWYEPLPDGSNNYTIMKKSDLVSGFPVGPGSKPGTILHRLASIESGWGGSSTIGGAPRNADGSRSRLSPREVFEAIENLLAS